MSPIKPNQQPSLPPPPPPDPVLIDSISLLQDQRFLSSPLPYFQTRARQRLIHPLYLPVTHLRTSTPHRTPLSRPSRRHPRILLSAVISDLLYVSRSLLPSLTLKTHTHAHRQTHTPRRLQQHRSRWAAGDDTMLKIKIAVNRLSARTPSLKSPSHPSISPLSVRFQHTRTHSP